jgi:hypothetical protein
MHHVGFTVLMYYDALHGQQNLKLNTLYVMWAAVCSR